MFVAFHVRLARWVLLGAAIVGCLYVARLVYDEVDTSRFQARLISEEARHHFFWVDKGHGEHRVPAPEGPLDRQRGYTDIPTWTDRLAERDFEVTWQATVSPSMAAAVERGVYPVYDPAHQAGLTILGSDGHLIYDHRTPGEVFDELGELPGLMVDTLLFIENRELLQPGYDYRNPAVEWRRFLHAVVALASREVGVADEHFGGSTLATQLQKFRHSPGGVTGDEAEKLRQMVSAALRAYRLGPRTAKHQRTLVLEYLNGVPLAASPGYGEVQGLPDGLRIWYGAEPDDVVERLHRLDRHPDAMAVDADDARAFRKVLSLFLAHRRPTHYLVRHPDELAEFTDVYLRVLASQGVITKALRDAALATEAPVLRQAPGLERPDFIERKAVDAVRTSLLTALDVPELYRLDRHDLYVQSTIDGAAQRDVSAMLRRMDDPGFVDSVDLYGHRLIHDGAPLDELTVSFTLYERTPMGNALRVLADNHDQPLNINEHVKLDLGSTAKLRTLVTYLEIIETLHTELSEASDAELGAIAESAPDALRRWTAHILFGSDDRSLEDILEAAMQKTYSADPNQTFFTAGGVHRFSNFEHRRNHTQTVEEAFRHSVNLVFIRMMRDIADYYMWLDPKRIEMVLGDKDSDERHYLLSRFADMEGTHFQGQFFDDYADRMSDDIPGAVVEGRTLSPESIAMVAMVFSDQTQEGLRRFVAEHAGYTPDDSTVERWWSRYHPDALNWQDRGYLTRIHPLELWTAAWLYDHPESTFDEAVVAAREVRQQVYQWLFRTRSRARQDQRLRIVLEREAFDQIHHAWRRLGYPFDELVPSLATSIGSSADRPIALAELVGIIANDGIKMPETRFDALIAGPDTPYETRFERHASSVGDPVMSKPVARILQNALVDVVERGTARRIRGELHDEDGTPLLVGGKTGTGDHDHEIYDGLRLVESRPVHRTATFAFTLDERFFGTITVFVSGEPAGEFSFTSALPTVLLNTLYPAFSHLVDEPDNDAEPEAVASTDPGGALAAAATSGAPAHLPVFDDNAILTAIAPPQAPQEAAILQWAPVLTPDPIRGFESKRRSAPDTPALDWNETLRPPATPTAEDTDGEPSA